MLSTMFVGFTIGLSGCMTAQSWQEGSCEESEDCRPWQACREGICIKDAATVACDILGDDCGVGQTCTRDADYGFSYCGKRPLRIGYLQQAAPNGSGLPTYTSDYFDYVLNTTELTELFALGTEGWSFELIEYTYDVENQEESLPTATAAMMKDDLDIILTMQSSRHAAAVSFNEADRLILGVYNRRADVVLEELEEQKSGGYPALDDRFDFTIAPIQYNDQATIAHYLSTRDVCRNLVIPIENSRDTDRLRYILTENEARRHGICVDRIDVATLEDGTPADLIEEFARIDTPEHCVFIVGRHLEVLADYIDHAKERGTAPQMHVVASASRINPTTIAAYPSLFDKAWREKYILLSFSTDKEDVGQFESELYVQTRYQDLFEQHCQGVDVATDFPCIDGLYDDFSTPDRLLINKFTLNYRRDLLTLSLLAAYRARLRFGEGFSRAQLRDSFLAVIEHEPDHTACDRTTIEDCFARLLARREVRFDGSSSPMQLGEDGRMLRLYETMHFDKLTEGAEPEFDMDRRVDYSGKQMLANHQQPIDDSLMCAMGD